MKKIVDIWAPVFVWMLLIFSFSSLPTNPVSEIQWRDFVVKKTAHIAIYAILTLLLLRSLRLSRVRRKKAYLFSVLFSIFYGAVDEYHQSFTPGRDPQLRDIVFDAIGSILAIYLVRFYLPKLPSTIREKLERWQLE